MWISELLRKNIDDLLEELDETALCLRALFTLIDAISTGRVRDAAVRNSLADYVLLFIELVHVRRRFQRQGLLTPLHDNFEGLLD